MTVPEVRMAQLSTFDLRKKFIEEWERVSNIMVRVYPLSDESLRMILRDLQSIHGELKRRNEPLNPELF